MHPKRILLIANAAILGGALVFLGSSSQIRADDAAPSSLESGTDVRPIHRLNPRYPQPEADAGVEGWVVVSYVVKPDGTVGETIIEDSSGRKTFEKETLKSMKDWRYEPATMNGEPIE
jgi:TonB family protein